MNRFNKPFIIVILISLISFGCGRSTSSDLPDPSTQQLWTMPDADTDGIPDTYDFPENTKTMEIPCELDDGTITYMDCSTTPDCNCNKIPDNEELVTTKNCGWGCVAGNARTYVMIGGALLAGYSGYALLSGSWPFGREDETEKDSQGNVIEKVTVDETNPIDWNNSPRNFLWDSHKKMMMQRIRGKCKSNLRPDGFDCGLEYKHQIDEFPDLSIGSYPKTGKFRYSYNRFDSEQYIKPSFGSGVGFSVKDSNWFGIKPTESGEKNEADILIDKNDNQENPTKVLISKSGVETKYQAEEDVGFWESTWNKVKAWWDE